MALAEVPEIATPKRQLPILTVSEIKTRRRCAREHQIAYRLGFRPHKRANALKFGSLFHDGLEAWWDTHGVVDAALGAMRADAEVDPYELARAEALMRGYHARWEGLEDELEVLAVEAEFSCALVNPATGAESRTWRLGGKIDAIVRNHDGEVYIVEHKTTTEDCELGSDYWRRLRLDAQISTYMVGARALGFEPAGCIYDIIRRPLQQPKKATPEADRKYTKDGRLYAAQRDTDETPAEFQLRIREAIAEAPEKYFVRGIVVRLEDEERDAAADTWATARQLREDELAKRWPRNPDACVRFGRECDFFRACTGEASLEDTTLFRKIDPDAPHEELSADTGNPNAAA